MADYDNESPRPLVDRTTSQKVMPNPTPGMMECGAAIPTDAMERFLTSFERSARRWEIVVYPALLAFIVLAAYGFFLIYNLTYDMHVVAGSLDPNMGEHMVQLSTNMEQMANNVAVMTHQIQSMTGDIRDISGKLDSMEHMENLAPMLTRLERMDHSMQNIVISMDMMRQDMAMMSKNVSRPMSMLNRMMPW
ncbi:MAG: hypothetical protein KDH88_08110 [Chromatiales bacterium]|nr:hypothetical protein [Chromatiales bacterium]